MHTNPLLLLIYIIHLQKSIRNLLLLPFKLCQYLIRYRKRLVSTHRRLEPNYLCQIISAVDITEICQFHGYDVQEHIVRTKDGYLLTIHRILKSDTPPLHRPVVYFHHGLLTNSELFVLGETSSRCLPFVLVDQGYDVWLGNNRGNKYSRKHMSLNCGQSEFWDYSLDEFALFDIPNTIDYILSSTGEPALTFIGFSQGSAQALAALSMSSDLNKQVKLFIGISPATIPQRLPNPFAGIFTRFPDLLFYVLGHRSVLPSVIAFSAMVLGPFHRFIVDISLNSIFHWKTKNISRVQKEIGYPHLFSPSSVKSLVHWLQIISSNRFQMFDDACHSIFSKITCTSFKLHRVTPFPINNVSTNVMLVYGMCDVLVSVDPFEQRLDNCRELEIIGIENYEHMDILWAQDVEFKVFKPVLEKINKINHGLMFDQYNDDVKVTEDLTNSSFNDLDQHYNSIVTKPVNININKDLGLSVEELPMSQSSLFV